MEETRLRAGGLFTPDLALRELATDGMKGHTGYQLVALTGGSGSGGWMYRAQP
jgi:hypothetical protein